MTGLPSGLPSLLVLLVPWAITFLSVMMIGRIRNQMTTIENRQMNHLNVNLHAFVFLIFFDVDVCPLLTSHVGINDRITANPSQMDPPMKYLRYCSWFDGFVAWARMVDVVACRMLRWDSCFTVV